MKDLPADREEGRDRQEPSVGMDRIGVRARLLGRVRFWCSAIAITSGCADPNSRVRIDEASLKNDSASSCFALAAATRARPSRL